MTRVVHISNVCCLITDASRKNSRESAQIHIQVEIRYERLGHRPKIGGQENGCRWKHWKTHRGNFDSWTDRPDWQSILLSYPGVPFAFPQIQLSFDPQAVLARICEQVPSSYRPQLRLPPEVWSNLSRKISHTAYFTTRISLSTASTATCIHSSANNLIFFEVQRESRWLAIFTQNLSKNGSSAIWRSWWWTD